VSALLCVFCHSSSNAHSSLHTSSHPIPVPLSSSHRRPQPHTCTLCLVSPPLHRFLRMCMPTVAGACLHNKPTTRDNKGVKSTWQQSPHSKSTHTHTHREKKNNKRRTPGGLLFLQHPPPATRYSWCSSVRYATPVRVATYSSSTKKSVAQWTNSFWWEKCGQWPQPGMIVVVELGNMSVAATHRCSGTK
jgi:hypothetical protein